MSRFFDHEKLEVYDGLMAFLDWLVIKANSGYRLPEGNPD